MEEQSLQYLIGLAKKKKELLDTHPLRYLIRAMLASVYIGFPLILCFKLGQQFNEVHSPATYFMSAIFFGIALILIIYGGAELFTGNTMYFTVATIRKETTIVDTLKNWFACYSGNLLGALFFALLFFATGLFDGIPNDHLLFKVAEKKMHSSIPHLFFKAILCNWMVCLAVFLPTRVKGDGPKMTIMILLVFAFFLSGYEHSIANLVLFATALIVDHPDTINIGLAIRNLIPVTLGNIVGGVVFMGMLYAYLNPADEVPAISSYDSHEGRKAE